jgi:hypothetical protein
MLGISVDSYDAVTWVSAQFSGTLNNWWLNRKQQSAIPYSFDSLVEELRETSLLPNIRDDAINAMLGITQANMSYADYSRLFGEFYEGLANLLHKTFSVFASLVDCLTFNFKHKRSPIVRNRGVTLGLWWSYKISSTTSLLIFATPGSC